MKYNNNTRGTRTVVRVVVKAGNLMKEKMKGKSIFYTPHMIGLPVGQSYQDTFFSARRGKPNTRKPYHAMKEPSLINK